MFDLICSGFIMDVCHVLFCPRLCVTLTRLTAGYSSASWKQIRASVLHITCKVKECDLHLSNSLAPRLRLHPVSRHSDPDHHPVKAAGLTTIYSLSLCEQLNRMSQHAHTFCDNMMLNDAVCTAALSYQGAADWQGSNGLTELFSHKVCIVCIFN